MKPGDLVGGRFEIERLAASGGMGDVYRAFDRSRDALAALKVLRGGDRVAAARFRREADLLLAMRHPGIVEYLAHGAGEDGTLYLAMEWLEGEDLSARVATAALEVADALSVGVQVAGALATAHARDVVHRDVKPSNIFLVDWRIDRVKFLDFGVARRAGLDPLTATGAIVGTPSYMAPEQAAGGKVVDARADVYALGAVLFCCLTGKPPFAADSISQLVARIVTQPPPRVRDLAPHVPPALDALIARMLAKDPARRPAGGAAALAELRAVDATPIEIAPTAVAEPPSGLVGRVAERDAIAARLDAADRSSLCLFTGEAGIGKSRLLEEAATLTRARGGLVLSGRAFEAEMVRPYGAWIDALRSASLGQLGPALSDDLAPLLPELGAARPNADRNRLFDAVAGMVRTLAGSGPVALLLDDLQWFDEASAALLHFVLRALDGRRVIVVGAARETELADNRAVQRLLHALERDRRLERMPLAPLATAETAALIRQAAPGAEVDRICAESEGNPLFALELARAGAEGRESIGALLDDRIARLDDDVREVVAFAAALGRSFDLPTLARVAGRPLASLLATAEKLERRAVVRVAAADPSSPRYDFSHDLLRQAAYRQLSEPRRRLVHLAIARALADGGGDAIAGEIAHHAALGGDDALAVRSAIVAAERSLRLFANAEAAALADRGLALVGRIPRNAASVIALYQILLLSGRYRGRAAEIQAAVGAALKEARADGLSDYVHRGLFVVSGVHFYNQNYDAAYATSIESMEENDADAAGRAEAMATAARCLIHMERDVGRAEALLREARELAVEAGVDPPDLTLGLGMLACFAGRYHDAVPSLEASARRAHDRGDGWRECEARLALVRAHLEHGHPEQALAACEDLRAIAAKMQEAPFATALEAVASIALDRPGAEAALGRAVADLVDMDCKHQLAYVLNLAAALELEQKKLDSARALAERGLGFARAVERTGEVVLARALLAQIDLVRGERASAEQSATELSALSADNISARSISAVRRMVETLGRG